MYMSKTSKLSWSRSIIKHHMNNINNAPLNIGMKWIQDLYRSLTTTCSLYWGLVHIIALHENNWICLNYVTNCKVIMCSTGQSNRCKHAFQLNDLVIAPDLDEPLHVEIHAVPVPAGGRSVTRQRCDPDVTLSSRQRSLEIVSRKKTGTNPSGHSCSCAYAKT